MAQRPISAHREYLSPESESLLDTYGVARNHFEHARDPSISQQHVDLAKEQDRGDRSSILENGGDRLPEYIPPERATSPVQERSGSSMVKDDSPQHNLRPPDDFAKSVDKEAFDKKWFEEQLRAEQMNDDRSQEWTNDR